jgi:SAM-dependent methyltransferase
MNTLDVLQTAPFDRAAATYDAGFTGSRLGRSLRSTVTRHLEAAFRPGHHVLELGCGTGEDAVHLARRGVWVTATDASPAMLALAREKAVAACVADRVHLCQLDLASPGDVQPPGADPPPLFDGVYSNFGPLNCVPDRRGLARALACQVRPGGLLVLVVMGPICPWEIGWHLLHGQVRGAFRRFGSAVEAHVGGGATVPVWYPSPYRLRADFAPWFRHIKTRGLGSFLPPTYLSHLAERWPRLFERLASLDRRAGPLFPWTWLNDHYIMVLSRR